MLKFLLLTAILSISAAGVLAQGAGGLQSGTPPDRRKCVEEPRTLFDLSDKGHAAYEDLLKAEIFETGYVGYAGTLSPHVVSLNTLMAEKESGAALNSLAAGATPAGRLYALSGLYYTDRAAFDIAAARLKNSEATVQVLSGCLMSDEKMGKIIDSGAANVAIIKPGQTMKEFWATNAGGFELDIAHGGYPASFREMADIKVKGR